MKSLLAHPGTQHAARLAHELAFRELLSEFWTGIAICESGWLASAVRALGFGDKLTSLGARLLHDIRPEYVRTMPWLEWTTLRRLRKATDGHEVLHQRNKRFQELIPQYSVESSDAIIAFDTSAWRLFERGRMVGKRLYLDRSIAHPDEWICTQRELAKRYPEWTSATVQRPTYLQSVEESEHDLADRIVVGGGFAKDTLVASGVSADKILVNPYGVDFSAFAGELKSVGTSPARPIRFLFLGTVCLRKGIPLLLDAWKNVGRTKRSAELWIAGPIESKIEKLIPVDCSLKLLGKVPRNEIPNLFSQCDVLVLPSYSEGFGLVLLEAVAAGLPVIASRNTGGREVVQSDALGQLFDAGDVDQLVEAMRFYLDCPPSKEVVRSASESLKNYFSWTAYGDRWAALLEEDQC